LRRFFQKAATFCSTKNNFCAKIFIQPLSARTGAVQKYVRSVRRMWLLRSFRFSAALLAVLACSSCASLTTPAPEINNQNQQAFEAFWRPLVPLYGQARFYENCGTRTPAWFTAVSNGLTERITRKAKRIWSDEDATNAFINQSAAFDPVARAIGIEAASADQTPATACEAPITTPGLEQLDRIAVREGYGR
jgi:hypothetical protein